MQIHDFLVSSTLLGYFVSVVCVRWRASSVRASSTFSDAVLVDGISHGGSTDSLKVSKCYFWRVS